MKSRKYLAIVLSFISVAGLAQSEPKAEVAWMSIEEALEKSKVEKKKIFIDVFTDWCGWCKVMDRETFSDPEVAKLLNEKFYSVKLNAETRKEDIVFQGTTFKYIETSPGRGVHQFAAALLQNQMSYPTVVFLSEELGMLLPLAGFKKPAEFHVWLTWLGTDAYKRVENIETYYKTEYKSPYAAIEKAKAGGE